MAIPLPGFWVLSFTCFLPLDISTSSPPPWILSIITPHILSTGFHLLVLFRVPQLSLWLPDSPSSSWLLFVRHSPATNAGLSWFPFPRFTFVVLVLTPVPVLGSSWVVLPVVPCPAAIASCLDEISTGSRAGNVLMVGGSHCPSFRIGMLL